MKLLTEFNRIVLYLFSRKREKMENLQIHGGALIIGSLLWQDDLNIENKDNIRKNWRKNNLVEETIKVNVPIRYGRYSEGGTYTMVFSKKCETGDLLGTGFVREFNSRPINSWEELKNQAIEMSKAEGMHGKFIGGKNDIWGTMSILFNPRMNKKKRDFLIKKWKDKIIDDGGGNDLSEYKFGDEQSAIKDDSTLNFDWFNPTNKEDKSKLDYLDFIICAVTKQKNPKSDNYPSTLEIANSVRMDKKRMYFINNVKYGISTFEDNLIAEKIEK